jgi:CheY-like chemotaxis protein
MVLCVDYDSGERMIVAATIGACGLRVGTAPSALTAMELVSMQGFAVVVIDYNLPDMTGARLARKIRAVEPSARGQGSAMDLLTDVISDLAPRHPSATGS